VKIELDKKLCQKYPKIFVNRDKPSSESAMHAGFMCEDGWFELIDQLCARLKAIQAETQISITAVQVKEKFGMLRFYASVDVSSSNLNKKDREIWYDLIYDVVRSYEDKSQHICEVCGLEDAQLERVEYTLKAVCDKHRLTLEEDVRELHEQIKHMQGKTNDHIA